MNPEEIANIEAEILSVESVGLLPPNTRERVVAEVLRQVDELKWETAVHESGHALVSHALGVRVASLTAISGESGPEPNRWGSGRYGGQCRHERASDWRAVSIAFAGGAAVDLFVHHVRTRIEGRHASLTDLQLIYERSKDERRRERCMRIAERLLMNHEQDVLRVANRLHRERTMNNTAVLEEFGHIRCRGEQRALATGGAKYANTITYPDGRIEKRYRR
jgi:hypothetical protein